MQNRTMTGRERRLSGIISQADLVAALYKGGAGNDTGTNPRAA